ncbi:hypothetical protein AB0M02_00915 [Actinoplanes sp. NPDC051861]|uniref:hypothetical protein n=1 Tax=Actinoplanes sp. NPDC051861 TaxID=3155170 RepID=UPI0034333B90
MLIVGLPFAVVAGWTLGAPAVRSAALGVTGNVDGTGGLGAAPARKGSTPDPMDGYTARPPRATAAPTMSLPAPVTPAGVVTTTVTVVATVPAPTMTTSPPPDYPQPPVPTPTSVDTPPVPTPTSASPSETPSPSVSGS